jgi:hypothetical protein
MSQISPILRRTTTGLMFWCPGCEGPHHINVNPGWTWNGDVDRPVFSPSVLVRSGHYAPHHKPGDDCWCTYIAEHPEHDKPRFRCGICHSFVGSSGAQPGEIVFLSDSTHALAGATVPLPSWPAGYGEAE